MGRHGNRSEGSPDRDESYDIIVIGAGVTGVAAAAELATDHDILVVDKGQVGGGTTSRASGLISTPASYPEIDGLGDHAMAAFRSLDETGVFSFTQREKLALVPEEGTENARAYARTSDDAEFLDATTVTAEYDNQVTLPGYGGALRYADTGFVDPIDYTLTLKQRAVDAGVEFRTDTAVEAIEVENDHVSGVETEYGFVGADTVVCAAGWRTRELVSPFVELPTRPVRWEAIELRPTVDVRQPYPMGSDPLTETYWRPIHGDNLLVGGNPKITEAPTESTRGVSDPFRETVLETIPTLLPPYEGADVVQEECCATPDAATPDSLPIVDAPAEAPQGLIAATGFQRGGVLTSPATAAAVRSLITGEECPFDITAFALDRFDRRSSDFDLVSIYSTFED